MPRREAILFREHASLPDPFRKLKMSRVHFCKTLKSKPRKISIPKSRYDYLLVSSKNALRYLRSRPKADKILGDLHGDRIMDYFKKRGRPGQSILYLRSNLGSKLGRSDIVPGLRRLGFRVSVRCSYRTEILPIRQRLIGLLKRHSIQAFLVTSPSTILAIKRALSKEERRQLRVRWYCMGSTTEAYLKRSKIR